VDQQDQSHWRHTRRQVLWTVGIVAVLTGAVLIGYRYGITLWDWIKLLIVPTAIAAGGAWLNQQQRAREQDIAHQRAQDEAVQAYLDQMSTLVLDDLNNAKVRTLMRARTLTVLETLDPSRKRDVMLFLLEAGLVGRGCGGATISGEQQRSQYGAGDIVSLAMADLHGAILRRALLPDATLAFADLRGAILGGAKLVGAKLVGAELSGAFLTDAKGVSNEELERQAKSLEGATMPNGQKYEDWLKSKGRGKDGENSSSS
jgi:Pentapeptide repeats (8 copies)